MTDNEALLWCKKNKAIVNFHDYPKAVTVMSGEFAVCSTADKDHRTPFLDAVKRVRDLVDAQNR